MTADLIQATFDYSALDPYASTAVRFRTDRLSTLLKRAGTDIIEIGQTLLEVKALLPHGQFGLWLAAEFGMTDRSARNFMTVAERFKSETVSDLIAPRALYLLAAPSVPDEARQEAIERAEAGEKITHSTAREIVNLHSPLIQNRTPDNGWWSVSDMQKARLSGEEPTIIETRPPSYHVADDSYDWYTPAEYIEAARAVLGTIDLDPASSNEAQEVVQASTYFTKEIDGLTQVWFGNVWMNPPYNMPLIEQFVDKVLAEYEAGNVNAAIVLTNNATDTRWFHTLLEHPLCLTKGRIRFWAGNGSLATRQGQAFFYLGDKPDLFAAVFSEFGQVMRRYAEPS